MWKTNKWRDKKLILDQEKELEIERETDIQIVCRICEKKILSVNMTEHAENCKRNIELN